MKRINYYSALHLRFHSIISFLLDMKKFDGLLQSTLILLSNYLLFNLFSKEEFNKPDYIMMIVPGFGGFKTIIIEAYQKKKEN